ncbi:MAG: isocitrate lyase/phosphoenolpyruvate mutase family protein [Candidatus Omnitrophica bacterium]|nr:isocitrate lyase/phosphoenolpyruvate mutase family protein [Candidatus Omnitrophota bacterium]
MIENKHISSPGIFLKDQIGSVTSPIIALPAADSFAAMEAYKAGAQALWVGSLEHSLRLGVPDSYVLGATDLFIDLLSMQKLLLGKVSIIADVDAGYGGINAVYNCFRGLNVLGVALGVIENKKSGIDKKNSILGNKSIRWQIEQKNTMLEKIYAARKACDEIKRTLVGVRMEDLTMGCSVRETLRSALFFEKAKPDLIILHSNEKYPVKLLNFAREYSRVGKCPLATITTSFGRNIGKKKLFKAGYKILIFANQNVRSYLVTTMKHYEKLLSDRAAGGVLDGKIATTKDLIRLSDSLKIKIPKMK